MINFFKIFGFSTLILLFFGFAMYAPTGVQHFIPNKNAALEHVNNIIEFEHYWHKYLLSVAQCDGEELIPEKCGNKSVPLDYKSWGEARKRAKKLFALEEPQDARR